MNKMNPDIINRIYPESLKPLPIWGLWRLEENQDGRITKVPYSANYNGRASSTAPSGWTSYERAARKLDLNQGKYNGVALFITASNKIVFIDLDHCISEDGTISEFASRILDLFPGQFVERSQSGTGLHIFTRGTFQKNINQGRKQGIEIYYNDKFCACTGDAISANEPTVMQESLDILAAEFAKPAEQLPDLTSQSSPELQNDDKWVIDHAKKHGRFKMLYEGDWASAGYESQSEADIALCMILAFWSNKNPEQIDRILRTSKLFRKKWLRDDYRHATIQKAIARCDEKVIDWQQRKTAEFGNRLSLALGLNWDNEIKI